MKFKASQVLACVVLAIVQGVSVEADPILWTGNGHYYELVEADGITWDSAQSAAEGRIYLGVSGYLATITSSSEHDFIAQNLLPGQTTRSIYLLGGIQRVDGAEPYGGWEWITGEPWGYTNWSWNNPNNDANQDVLAIYGNPSDMPAYTYWDDYWTYVGTHTGGYIVEYPVGYTVPHTRNILVLSSTTGGRITTPGEGGFGYEEGSVVMLQAQADSGYYFTHWSGSILDTSNPMVLIINSDHQVKANFAKATGSYMLALKGAAVTSYSGSQESLSFENSQDEGGIEFKAGYGDTTATYTFLLPPKTFPGGQISYIEVTLDGDKGALSSWPTVTIGAKEYSAKNSPFKFLDADARDLLVPDPLGIGSQLSIVLNIPTLSSYALAAVKLTFKCEGPVSGELVGYYQEAISSAVLLKIHNEMMVSQYWDVEKFVNKSLFLPAVVKSVSMAMSLLVDEATSRILGDLGEVVSAVGALEDWNELARLIEKANDYSIFWIKYYTPPWAGPEPSHVSTKYAQASSCLGSVAKVWCDTGFNKVNAVREVDIVNETLRQASEAVVALKSDLWDCGVAMTKVYRGQDVGSGRATAELMLKSLNPLIVYEYSESEDMWKKVFDYLETLAAHLDAQKIR